MRRTRAQMAEAGETPEKLRAALDAHDARKGWPDPDTWMEMRKAYAEELAILEGRIFPNSIEFDHR